MDTFAPWHDFFMLLGEAAATLVGLTFVAASVGCGVMKREHEVGVNLFITPTMVHFAAILFVCLLVLAPASDAVARAVLIGAEALLGLVYSSSVVVRMRRHGFHAQVMLVDRVWYALAPVIAYAVLAWGAALNGRAVARGNIVLAVGLCLLLFAAIRNAWDMVVWMMLRRDGGG